MFPHLLQGAVPPRQPLTWAQPVIPGFIRCRASKYLTASW